MPFFRDRSILEEIDIGAIRQSVFALYEIGNEPAAEMLQQSEQRTLLKAFYTYMSDRNFEEQVR